MHDSTYFQSLIRPGGPTKCPLANDEEARTRARKSSGYSQHEQRERRRRCPPHERRRQCQHASAGCQECRSRVHPPLPRSLGVPTHQCLQGGCGDEGHGGQEDWEGGALEGGAAALGGAAGGGGRAGGGGGGAHEARFQE